MSRSDLLGQLRPAVLVEDRGHRGGHAMAHVEGPVGQLRPLPRSGVAAVEELPRLTGSVAESCVPHFLLYKKWRYSRREELPRVVEGPRRRVVGGGLGYDTTSLVDLLLPVHPFVVSGRFQLLDPLRQLLHRPEQHRHQALVAQSQETLRGTVPINARPLGIQDGRVWKAVRLAC